MSTRCEDQKRGLGFASHGRLGLDGAEQLALVAQAKRPILLRVHRHRLRSDDLEECFSQALLELLAQVRRGHAFSNAAHMANALELRFVSRIHDRRRALAGRSPSQSLLELALSWADVADLPDAEVADSHADTERIVLLRMDLRRLGTIVGELSADQRLVLDSQVWDQATRAEFCERHGWSLEKYRKVAQRARARLRSLEAAAEEAEEKEK